MHNGGAAKGMAASQFKHGRHSKYMPAPMQADHAERLANIAATARLDEEITIIDMRISELLARLSTGERGTSWEDIQAAIIDARLPGSSLVAFLERLYPIVSAGLSTESAWWDIIACIHDKAKITATEARRAADAGEVATKQEVNERIYQIMAVVRDRITPLPGGQQALRDIFNDLVSMSRNRPGGIGNVATEHGSADAQDQTITPAPLAIQAEQAEPPAGE